LTSSVKELSIFEDFVGPSIEIREALSSRIGGIRHEIRPKTINCVLEEIWKRLLDFVTAPGLHSRSEALLKRLVYFSEDEKYSLLSLPSKGQNFRKENQINVSREESVDNKSKT
jgi:hypothetical protein